MQSVNTGNNEIATIEALAQEARALRLSIDINMWQLAKVFAQAKAMIPHGEWQKWLQDNADVSVRTAEDMIASYRRFGGKPEFEKLGRAKIFRLLPLPEDMEERFMSENDVENMSSRELQEAVRQAREEAREEAEREIQAEREARMEAEERAREAEEREPEIPEELKDELRRAKETAEERLEEINRLAQMGREAIEERNRTAQENSSLRRELEDRADMIREQQEDYNRVQSELLNIKSAIAKGDAERAPRDALTLDIFAQAVRQFIGSCFRMPQIRTSFAAMDHADKAEYNELLSTIEDWCRKSRSALDSVTVGEAVIYSE